MSVRITLALEIRVLEMVDRIILRFIDENRERSSRFSDKRGYSLNGKTTILRIVISRSTLDISIKVREAQLG
jgi:hypothetical protein